VIHLTEPQNKFLRDLWNHFWLESTLDENTFVRLVRRRTHQGIFLYKNKFRVVTSLLQKGVLSDVKRYGPFGRHVEISFTDDGAHMLFRAIKNALQTQN
jgi:hypothetical protein